MDEYEVCIALMYPPKLRSNKYTDLAKAKARAQKESDKFGAPCEVLEKSSAPMAHRQLFNSYYTTVFTAHPKE
jgi:hypothetical protein